MPLAQAVNILKRQCTVIKSVQFRYNDQVGVYSSYSGCVVFTHF